MIGWCKDRSYKSHKPWKPKQLSICEVRQLLHGSLWMSTRRVRSSTLSPGSSGGCSKIRQDRWKTLVPELWDWFYRCKAGWDIFRQQRCSNFIRIKKEQLCFFLIVVWRCSLDRACAFYWTLCRSIWCLGKQLCQNPTCLLLHVVILGKALGKLGFPCKHAFLFDKVIGQLDNGHPTWLIWHFSNVQVA